MSSFILSMGLRLTNAICEQSAARTTCTHTGSTTNCLTWEPLVKREDNAACGIALIGTGVLTGAFYLGETVVNAISAHPTAALATVGATALYFGAAPALRGIKQISNSAVAALTNTAQRALRVSEADSDDAEELRARRDLLEEGARNAIELQLELEPGLNIDS